MSIESQALFEKAHRFMKTQAELQEACNCPVSPAIEGTEIGRLRMYANASKTNHPVFYALVFGIDSWLRRWRAVIEYSTHPDCIFRLQTATAERPIQLQDGTVILPGERILELHLWGEQVPRIPQHGVTIAWALQMRRCVELSLRQLAAYLRAHRELDDVMLIRGNVVFCAAERCPQLARLCTRLGFQDPKEAAANTILERTHRFSENILISLVVLAINSRSVRADTLRRTRLTIYITRARLMSHFDALGCSSAGE